MDVPCCDSQSNLRHNMKLFFDTMRLWWDRRGRPEACDIEMNSREVECRPPAKTIEEFRAGYPRFCAYVAANPDFLICRRFLRLRSRLLCLKQDKLSQLEEQLDNLDHNETSPLFLGMSRCDRNTARTSLLSQVSVLLDDYDSFLEKTHQILNYSRALPRDVSSLRNWMMNGSLSRDERRYLDQQQDLVNLGSSSDAARKNVENWVEDLLVDNWEGFRSTPGHEASTDPSVYLYSGSLIRRITDVLMLSLIALLLLFPVIICVLITSTWARIAVITLATLIYLSILSRLTKAKMIELVLAGATFATILNVFVTGMNNN
ncbi:hypothetical protein L207DRAFT_572531 [Hyaloscypha variabilis F]|uniref:DUF6594 domain-containing protein n=1 Tax=Hyaloscypha variabilis (strain UAMH 11265 / GT02V1 / F) TaxID=1149755 RepID=A0A2J6QZQ9_HYAVF|nr:hypothetical protein L207DRAFT_572531 [Hyaloscypha variabilis F]